MLIGFIFQCNWLIRRQLLHPILKFSIISQFHFQQTNQSIKGIMVTPKQSASNIKIGTHNGTFHCDEILACFLLKRLPRFKDAEIVRTRDNAVLETCDIVVDVGGIFDPSRHRYDHHQGTFSETMNSLSPDKPWKTKLSSAGLVYYHFGKEVIETYVGNLDKDLINTTFDQVYEHFIQEIDGIDNGVPMFDGEPKYRIWTNLSARVSYFNSQWNSETDFNENQQFFKAMKLVGDEFEDCMNYVTKVWWPARSLILQALERRFMVHESGEIMELLTTCPWKEHVFALEKELNIERNIKFVLFTDTNGNWRIQSVPINVGSFVARMSILPEWQGLRDEQLSEVSGIAGGIFVHATGFIGGNKTRDGVLQMAIKCLKNRDDNENK